MYKWEVTFALGGGWNLVSPPIYANKHESAIGEAQRIFTEMYPALRTALVRSKRATPIK